MANLEINRRNLIVAAGAGALAGCGKGESKRVERDPNNCGPRGWFDSFGLDPNFKDWSTFEQAYPLSKLPKFTPRYITLVRISAASGKNWALDVNHASLDASGLEQEGRESLVNEAFDLLGKNSKWRMKQLKGELKKQLYPREKPAPSSGSDPVIDIDGFDYLGSNSPVEIYIWVDLPESKLIEGHYITFSPLSSEGQKKASFPYFKDPYKQQDISPNDSYFATKFSGSTSGRNVIQIRNYFKDYDFKKEEFSDRSGDTLKPRAYGLNIHFAILDNKGKSVPMVIDPDTGNGSGWEP